MGAEVLMLVIFEKYLHKYGYALQILNRAVCSTVRPLFKSNKLMLLLKIQAQDTM